jgi:hypothetical protein
MMSESLHFIISGLGSLTRKLDQPKEKKLSGATCPAAYGNLPPVSALIAAKTIGGIFLSPAASGSVGFGFINGIGGDLRLSLFIRGSAP